MKNSFDNVNVIYVVSILFVSFNLLFLSLNNKPCCEPRLVSSVMADYISTYYFLYRILSITFIISLQEIYYK